MAGSNSNFTAAMKDAPWVLGLGPSIGITMNLVGSTLINLGSNLIKLAHIKRLNQAKTQLFTLRRAQSSSTITTQTSLLQEEELLVTSVDKRRRSWCICCCSADVSVDANATQLWVAGWCLFVVGNVLNFASFSFTTQSLLAPLGSVQFITNIAFGKLVLGRKISLRMYSGTVVLVIGIVLIVLFSSKTDTVHRYSLTELESLTLRHSYLFYLAVILSSFLFATIGQRWCTSPNSTVGAVAYAVSSAVIGAQSVTFFKVLSELLAVLADSSDRITRVAVVTSPFTYGILVAAIASCMFWMYRLNNGLRRFDALLIIPLFQVLWVTVSTIGGGIYFQEFQEFSVKMGILFVLGLCIVFLGVYLLSTSPPPKRKLYQRTGEPVVAVNRQNSLSGLRDLARPLIASTDINQQRTVDERSTVSSQSSWQRLHAEYATVTSIRSALPAVGSSFPPFLTQEEQQALVNISEHVSKMHFSFGMPMISAVQHDMWTESDEHHALHRSDTM